MALLLRILAMAAATTGFVLEGLGLGILVAAPHRIGLALGSIAVGLVLLAIAGVYFRRHPVRLWRWVKAVLDGWP